MSEVEKFKCIGYMVGRSRLGGAEYVFLSDFDRVTAEREALQQRLTAADERADVLEGLVRDAQTAFNYDPEGSCYNPGIKFVKPWSERAIAALKPAERTNTSGKAHCPHDGICHTSNETCAQAMARVAQIEPAEGADYRKSCEVANKALSMENQRITPVEKKTDPRLIDAMREAGYLRND